MRIDAAGTDNVALGRYNCSAHRCPRLRHWRSARNAAMSDSMDRDLHPLPNALGAIKDGIVENLHIGIGAPLYVSIGEKPVADH